jgi:hypothetical protein
VSLAVAVILFDSGLELNLRKQTKTALQTFFLQASGGCLPLSRGNGH